LQEEAPVQREIYAIDNDEIDVRLIQRQISNAIGQSHGGKKSADNNAAPQAAPLLEPVDKKRSSVNSKEDSMDVNDLVKDGEANFSMDLLEQLTSKISSEFNLPETPAMGAEKSQNDTITQEPDIVEPVQIEPEFEEDNETPLDENEENINSVEANEDLHAEEVMNTEVEKTVVTEQICEYPINPMDTEYIQTLDYLEGDKRYKKFVVYIDEQNVDFITSLSIQERKDIINSILREQDDIRIARREEERRKKLVTHLLIGIITFIVFIPLLYLIVNQCLEATISNYQRSQNNFEVLYKERGKIKSTSKY